ncbi:MAG TPA: phosphoribosylanthranilate isomerase [Gemmatimonadaceae bacterium]|nr:phosphoribosylanthranilate isomerase [Gemmatimonadaceae bacterium]
MPVEVKFCGLTRAADADVAASLGARYVGVIFADSPRRVDPPTAAAVVSPARGRARAVGVFGPSTTDAIRSVTGRIALDVVQLHGDPTPDTVERVRPVFAGEVWAVVRVATNVLPPEAFGLFEVADAVVLDTRVAGRLGGTGTPFAWDAVARSLDGHRAHARVVLAGGLTPANVGDAMRAIAPDVVDVSSGVETAPGIKDHARMRAFADAVRGQGSTKGATR